MLTVTDNACAHLSEKLLNFPAKAVLRIVRKSGRMKLRIGGRRPSDETFDHNGRIVLVLGERAAAHVADKTLDVRETEGGPKLRLCRAK